MQLPNESSHLSGKVRKRALEVFEAAPASGAPTVKRLLLPHGELAQFYDDEKPIHYLAFIELREGSARGNHYHKFKEEFIYVLQGEVLLLIEDIETKARESLPVRAGELVAISTGVAHVLRIVQAGQAVEFSKTRFDAGDIHRYPLV